MIKQLRIILVVFLMLVIGLLVSACVGGGNKQPVSPAQNQVPADQVAKSNSQSKQNLQAIEKISMSYTARSYSFLPLQVAIARGFFQEQGLEVEAVQMKSNVGMAALETAETAYTLTFGTSIEAILKGLPFKVVGIVTAKPLHYVVSQPEITSVNQLAGKVIGTVLVGGSDDIAARIAIRGKGGDDSKLKSTGIGDAPLLTEALRKKIIDLAPLVPPWPAQMAKEGFNILAGPKDLTNDQPLVGVVTQTKRIRENPEQIKKVLRAMLMALQYMRENKEGTVQVMMEWLNEDKNTASSSYDLIIHAFSRNGEVSRQDMEEVIAMRKQGATLTNASGSFEDVVDFTLLHDVQKELKL